MQDQGQPNQCWALNAAACRVCVALGGRFLANIASNESSWDVRGSICWCYILDKALSMNLSRPACLPEMNLNAAVLAPLDPTRPFSAIISILLDLSNIQDSILLEMRSRPGKKDPDQKRAANIEILERRMRQIRSKMNEVFVHLSSEASVLTLLASVSTAVRS